MHIHVKRSRLASQTPLTERTIPALENLSKRGSTASSRVIDSYCVCWLGTAAPPPPFSPFSTLDAELTKQSTVTCISRNDVYWLWPKSCNHSLNTTLYPPPPFFRRDNSLEPKSKRGDPPARQSKLVREFVSLFWSRFRIFLTTSSLSAYRHLYSL